MQTKTIRLLLSDGTTDGMIDMEDSEWPSGELYSIPRDKAEDIIKNKKIDNVYGIYLLLSKEKVYIGQASDLSRRITQHLIGIRINE